jgi:ubiquitin-conjugating enzyme E2 M
MPLVFKRRNKPKNLENQLLIVQTAAHLRIQRDFADLEIQSNIKIIRKFDEWMNFSIIINPQDGYWKEQNFEFEFKIPEKYPFDAIKVKCLTKIWHPNIDLNGSICINILRPWKPTYSIQTVLFALLFLFKEPNPNDPLNNEAAAEMRNDMNKFLINVKKYSHF